AYGVSAAADRFDRQQFAFKICAAHYVEQRSAARDPFALPEFGFFQWDAVEMLPAVHRRASECRKGGSKHGDCSLTRRPRDQMPASIQQCGSFRTDMAPQRGIDFLEQQTAGTTDQRLNAFVASFPADREHRWSRDLAAEVLHFTAPDRYPLM